MAERVRTSSTSRFHGLVITNVKFTEEKLGRGADATVYAVKWNGTVCAAKCLHEILLEDESPGGADKLIGNFEAECLTWSKLRHPGVVQFLGVYLDRRSRLPVLVMEKMDTSLRKYLEDHSKEEFPLHQKAFVLRQVAQALAYLHSQNPPLVHHDLSPNNVLLSVVSFLTKVSDFGMSRAINPSTLSRKSSIKGTPAFMAPEALHDPPQYNEKLDVFSFGSVILHTLTHEWPDPGPPTRYEEDKIIGLSELQRRKRYVEMFTAQEKELFLPTVRSCLENNPKKRPSSVMLVQNLRHIELTLPRNQLTVSQKVRHPPRDWKKLGECQKVIQHSPEGGRYCGVAVNSEGLLAVTDEWTNSVHLLSKEGALVRSIKKRVHGDDLLRGVAFDLKGNIWVVDSGNHEVAKLSQDGQHLHTICCASTRHDYFSHPLGVSVSPEGLIVICDSDNHRVTVHDEEGKFLCMFGSKGSGPGCFDRPLDTAFGSDGLMYITDHVNKRVCVWSSEGTFRGDFKTKYAPTCIAATSDNHLLITSYLSHTVMVYTLHGHLVHEFGERGYDLGRFNGAVGICIDSSRLAQCHVVDMKNKRVQIF